ncbi:hypothetical protein [Kitasatospora sp. McL0602]|uniref:hypothetical protein n=1 Tax=Kitasatospora sp. McL0602 TaxID=3439530 RepID=UPI003F8C65D3
MPRHAAADRDRVGTVLTASWAALHIATAILEQAEAGPAVTAPAATSPDTEPATA